MTISLAHKAIAHLLVAIAIGDTAIKIDAQAFESFTRLQGDDVYAILRGPVDREIVKIDISGSVNQILAVERGHGGTTAKAWPVGTLLFASTHEDHYNALIQAGETRLIDYNPNEILTPLYGGEKVYQTGPAGCERWWKSFNGVDPYWDIITGAACAQEVYEDIGWDYELLMPGDPWSMKKSLYAVNSSLRWIYSMAYDSSRHNLFAGTRYLCNIWKSDDGGATWALNKDLSASDEAIYSMVYDAYHDVLIAGTNNGGQIWRSTDGGASWNYVQRLGSELTVKALAYDPSTHTVIAGTYSNAQLWKSTDGGETWAMKKDVSNEPNGETYILSLTVDTTRNRFIAGTGIGDGELYVSTDDGETWTLKKDLSLESPAQTRIESLAYDANSDIIVAGTYADAQLWLSDDGGETWSMAVDLSLKSPAQYSVDALIYNPANTWIFAGTAYDAQVWVSKNGGATWELDQELEHYSIYSFAYDAYHERLNAGIGNNIGSPGAEIWTRGNQ